MRHILGVLSLAKKYGTAAVDEACAAALDMGVQEYRLVRRYLERCPQAPLSLQQVDPLIRDPYLVCTESLVRHAYREQPIWLRCQGIVGLELHHRPEHDAGRGIRKIAI